MKAFIKSIRFRPISMVCALLLSGFFTLGRKIVFSGSVFSGWKENYFVAFNMFDLVLFVLFGLLVYFCLLIVIHLSPRIHTVVITNRVRTASCVKIVLLFSLGLALLWSPYFLSFYPGFVLGDSLSSIRQAMWGIASNHHPVLYTLFIKVFITIGRHLGSLSSLNTGVFLYALFQYLVMAVALGSLLALLYYKNVRLVYVIAAGLFFSIMPFFPSYALILWKDPLFSLGLALLSIYLYILVENPQSRNRKYMWLLLIVGSFLTLYFRNNGVYIYMAVLLLLIIFVKKQAYKTALFMGPMLIVYLAFNAFGLSYLGIETPSVESYGVPIQQVAYVAAQNQDALTEQEAAVIGGVLPLEKYAEAYDPCLVDSIKWNESFSNTYWEQHRQDFLRTYLSLLPKHFSEFVKAYCLETFGFWHPYSQNEYGYIDQFVADNTLGIHTVDAFKMVFGFSIQENLSTFRPMLGSGTLVWILFLSLTLCLELGQKKRALFFAPSLFLWLSVMIATPVAFSFRYVYVLAILFPLMLVYPFLHAQTGCSLGQEQLDGTFDETEKHVRL